MYKSQKGSICVEGSTCPGVKRLWFAQIKRLHNFDSRKKYSKVGISRQVIFNMKQQVVVKLRLTLFSVLHRGCHCSRYTNGKELHLPDRESNPSLPRDRRGYLPKETHGSSSEVSLDLFHLPSATAFTLWSTKSSMSAPGRSRGDHFYLAPRAGNHLKWLKSMSTTPFFTYHWFILFSFCIA